MCVIMKEWKGRASSFYIFKYKEQSIFIVRRFFKNIAKKITMVFYGTNCFLAIKNVVFMLYRGRIE